MEPTQEMPQWPQHKLRWHESLVAKIAAIVSLVLVLGYTGNVFIGVQSIDTLARLIFDQEVDSALDQHLAHIKEIHSLRQQLLLEKLKPYVEAWQRSPDHTLTQRDLETWLTAVGEGGDNIAELLQVAEISQSTPEVPKDEKITPFLVWLDKENLQVLNFVVHFPKGPLFKTFEDLKELRQRYLLLGHGLTEQIRPTLIRTNAIALVISFLILAFTLLFFGRKLKTYLQEILQGFEQWRLGNFNFRFSHHFPGELGLIAHQFDTMAEDIEVTRQKSMYLEKIASWQVIARKLAHEIKNPLTPIQMMMSQLTRAYKGEDPQFQQLLDKAHRIITEEVAGLRHMVDHFSHFARLPAPIFAERDLVPLLSHTVELEQTAFPQHSIVLHDNVEMAYAWVDENLIRQVFLNLIKNAAQACGETPSRIEVRLRERSATYIVEVEDNGPGISPENVERIFEAYFTTKHTGPSPGMGLGLAICQKIILDHKGDISVQSTSGKTVFQVRLPKHK